MTKIVNDEMLKVGTRAERRNRVRSRPKRGTQIHIQERLERQRNLNKFDAAGTIIGWLDYLRKKHNTPGRMIISPSNFL